MEFFIVKVENKYLEDKWNGTCRLKWLILKNKLSKQKKEIFLISLFYLFTIHSIVQ